MTANIEALRELETILEAARGPSRELDARIIFALFARPVERYNDGVPEDAVALDGDWPEGQSSIRSYLWPEDHPTRPFAVVFDRRPSTIGGRQKGEDGIEFIRPDGTWILMNSARVPPLTGNTDAAASLVARLFPGTIFETTFRPAPERSSVQFVYGHSISGATPAIAITRGAVDALIARLELDAEATATPGAAPGRH